MGAQTRSSDFMTSDSDEKEAQLLSAMNTLYSTNREDVRRTLLDQLIIILFRPAYDPTRFIDAGGIMLLIRATSDRSEIIRASHGSRSHEADRSRLCRPSDRCRCCFSASATRRRSVPTGERDGEEGTRPARCVSEKYTN